MILGSISQVSVEVLVCGAFLFNFRAQAVLRASDISVGLMGLVSGSTSGCRGIFRGANYLRQRRGDQTWPVRNPPVRGEMSDGVLLKK